MKEFTTRLPTAVLITLLLCSACYSSNAQQTTAGQQLFSIGVTDSLYSRALGETRIVNIYLPPGYTPDSVANYPVIYLLDGSADEDFVHVSGLVQFCNFPWINFLPESIVVGIANTHRQRDFTHAVENLDFVSKIGFSPDRFPEYGGSANFMHFIEEELQPFIQKKYSSNPNKMLIGQSLGGLLATEMLLKKPELFGTYIIISPSLWWGNGSLLDLPTGEALTTRKVYIAVGKEGKMMTEPAKKLAGKLKKSGTLVQHDYLPDENHATIGHMALYKAFVWLAGTVK